MQNLIYKGLFFLSIVSLVFVGSCTQEYDDLVTGDAVTGGLVEVQNKLVNYVIGDDATYNVSLKVKQGAVKTNKIDIYKQFVSGAGSSEEVLFKTIDVTNTAQTSFAEFTATFAELIEGLTVNGEPLPTDDSMYEIGDFWSLSYKTTTDAGTVALNNDITKIAISTRLAGIYTITQGIYVHPSTAPDPAALYAGSYDRIIESVDAFHYKMTDIGPWEGEPTNFFYFRVNEDNTITIPKEWNGETQLIWGADELANCVNNPNELPDVSCSDMVELKDDGKDVISISYGYIRDTGTRQFDDIMVKQ